VTRTIPREADYTQSDADSAQSDADYKLVTPLQLFVLAVILSEAKDPETLDSPPLSNPFQPQLSTSSSLPNLAYRKINLQKVKIFECHKSGHQHTTIHHQSTTTSPRFNHRETPQKHKTPLEKRPSTMQTKYLLKSQNLVR
jgi:hypothetical protein